MGVFESFCGEGSFEGGGELGEKAKYTAGTVVDLLLRLVIRIDFI